MLAVSARGPAQSGQSGGGPTPNGVCGAFTSFRPFVAGHQVTGDSAPPEVEPELVEVMASWEQLAAAFGRWHVENRFERAKQEARFGAFEVRTYTSLIRHWLCTRMVMYLLAAQTQRLRGRESADHAGAGGLGGHSGQARTLGLPR